MNLNTSPRSMVFVWWILTVVVMVIHGQMDRELLSQRYYQSPDLQEREMDEFDQYNENVFSEKYERPYGPRPQRHPSYGMDQINRMGEDFRLRMQNLRSMVSSYTRSSYGGASSSSDGNEGCCDKLDFHTVVPGFVLVAVSYLLLFLLNATVTSGRRRRMVTSSEEEEQSKSLLINLFPPECSFKISFFCPFSFRLIYDNSSQNKSRNKSSGML